MTCSETTEKLLAEGYIQFTIDQQPYLQGFLPVIELYLYKVSKTLTGMADVEHRPEVPEQRNRRAVLSTKSRFEGTSSTPGVLLGAGRGGRVRQRSSGTSSIRGSGRMAGPSVRARRSSSAAS